MRPNYSGQFKQQTGVSMIEILVLVIIMSIGLLGIAGLQVTGLKQTTNAGFQTQAMLLAEDLIERVRANREAAIPFNSYEKKHNTDFSNSAVAACATAAGCTKEQMAANDLFSWSQLVQNSLPVDADRLKDDTFICIDSDSTDATNCDGAGSTFVIQIGWNETSSTDSAEQIQRYQMVFEP